MKNNYFQTENLVKKLTFTFLQIFLVFGLIENLRPSNLPLCVMISCPIAFEKLQCIPMRE